MNKSILANLRNGELLTGFGLIVIIFLVMDSLGINQIIFKFTLTKPESVCIFLLGFPLLLIGFKMMLIHAEKSIKE